METLYIVMPAYNEEENIKDVVVSWYRNLSGKSEKSKIVVADTGSTDRTHEILEEMKRNGYPQLEVINTQSQFHGPKVIALYNYAINSGADYIFQTDSDGQTEPNEFDGFWKERKDYSALFGNRVSRGDGKKRAFIEKVVCFLVKLYFGVQVPDANAPFRLMRAETLGKFLSMLPEDYAIPNIMITTFFAHYEKNIMFKNVTFKPRQAGTNSINIVKIIGIGKKALIDFKRFRGEMKI